MTPTQAFIVGILVFLAQQFIDKLSVTPILRFRECIAEIDHLLKFYYNLTTNSFSLEERRGNGCIEAMDEIRRASCKIEVSYKAIFGRRLFVAARIIPEWQSIALVSGNLIHLSNMVGSNPMAGYKLDEDIRNLLGISRMQ